jgi:hypothetical protein
MDYLFVGVVGFVLGQTFERWTRWRMMRNARKRQKHTEPDAW